jgi:hypothetical protein
VGRCVDAPGQAADDRQAGLGQAGGQPLRLAEAVVRRVPRADDGDRRLVLRPELAAKEEHGRRVVDLAEQHRIRRFVFGQDRHAQLAAMRDLLFGVVLLPGGDDLFHQFRPHALDAAQLAGSRVERRLGRAETVQQCPAGPRTDAGDQRQAKRVDQFFPRLRLVEWLRVAHAGTARVGGRVKRPQGQRNKELANVRL